MTLLSAYRPSLFISLSLSVALILSSSPARSLPGFSSSHGGNSHSSFPCFLAIFVILLAIGGKERTWVERKSESIFDNFGSRATKMLNAGLRGDMFLSPTHPKITYLVAAIHTQPHSKAECLTCGSASV